jgi:hypothetical protein
MIHQSIKRAAVYLWASPTTFLGLLFVPPALFAGGMRIVDGVLEIHGGVASLFLRRCTLLPGGASAMTLGHVVLGRTPELLDLTRDHERVHVRQCERWGPLFVPAYLLASLFAGLRGGDAYRDNPFEREAYARADVHLPYGQA